VHQRPGLGVEHVPTHALVVLVARAETSITQSDITDIMHAGSFIMAPYTQNPLQIVIREVQSSTTSATSTKQSWSCTYTDSGSTLTCTCLNAASERPVSPNKCPSHRWASELLGRSRIASRNSRSAAVQFQS